MEKTSGFGWGFFLALFTFEAFEAHMVIQITVSSLLSAKGTQP